ncbi:alpha/beta fold hydrolase [Kitasatospora cathayae]|uniref:Alpha/beta fold hydrolase n=1 Tax=Kitasatospora cathayae TaxID=3004092 RepID=A0ABY7QFR4_9ACTN|nr:alpha/beta fold hydrolase [Kitasatospora sp. HUAS 3-15]WBP91249.1 alpha/beta fold hydrolase [Kitasatospora sp. HUAS 3-15]
MPTTSLRTRLRRVLTAALAATATLTLAVPAFAASAPQQPAAPKARISWSACTDAEFAGMQCGTLQVPVDYAHPRAERLTLALVRRPADDHAHRQGALLLNDGAGGSSIEQLRLAMRIGFPSFAGAMSRNFDLVAVDPRGVGHSTPIRCSTPLKPVGITHVPHDQAQFDALVAHNRAFAEDCLRENGPLVAQTDLTSTARDFEAVRTGLGEKQLNWYGIHYSTLLGRTYADLYPGRLRTMVLDTALDDTTSPAERIRREAATAEDAFNRFTAWCAASTDCALHGKDAAAEYDALVARADRAPIPVNGGGRPLTGEDIRTATQDHLTLSGVTWPAFAQALVKAQAGDASGLAYEPDDTLDPVQVQVPACLDNARPVTTLDQLTRLHGELATISPHLGGAVRSWTALTGCLGWPLPARPVTAGAPVHGAPPALIVQSTHQALAPHSNGAAMARQLPGSVVLSREGDDYSTFLLSACVREATNRYLTTRALPAPGTTCTD